MFGESGSDTSDGTVMIEARELVKRFGEREALKGVSFDAHRGRAAGGDRPQRRRQDDAAVDPRRDQAPGRRHRQPSPGEIGWIPQQAALYRRLTVTENLRLFAHLEKVADVDAVVEEMLDQTGLAERRDDQVGTLSGGNQQRINIAIGLLARPRVLLLDEPSAGLDPRQRERLWEFVLGLAGGGTTVIFSTHNIAEAERYGQRLLVLADGEALFDGTSAELHAAVPGVRARRDFEQAFVAFLRDRGH